VQHFDLGEADGVPLGFTDGTALPDGRLVFCAVAERADDSYQDGPCAAAGVGIVGADFKLQWVRRLSRPHKVEGIAVRPDGRLLLVTDADDARVPASLYASRATVRSVRARKQPSRRLPSPRR
jgi:sugar lactone lactonase YvrE